MMKFVVCRRWIVCLALTCVLRALFGSDARADKLATNAEQLKADWANFFSDCSELLKICLQQQESIARCCDPRQSVLVRVVDADEKPISGVKITPATILGPEHDLSDHESSGHINCWPSVTGIDGCMRVAKPVRKGDGLALEFERADYASVEMEWDDATNIPAKFTCQLGRSRPIGGILRDEAGRPVAGATLELSLPDSAARDRTHYHLFMHEERTDAQGRWHCDHLPPKLQGLSINVVHGEHVELPLTDTACAAKLAELQLLKAVFVMQTGMILAGRVTDAAGRPVKDARLDLADRGPARVIRYPQAVTDNDGRYRIANCPPGKNAIIISAEGLKWQRREVDIRPEMAAVDFRLQPGQPVKIRVIDQDGQAICGARVEDNSPLFSNMPPITYDNNTDRQGRWHSFGEPEGEVSVSVSKAGYATVHDRFAAGGDVHNVVLPRPICVVVRVIDAKTKQPLKGVHLSVDFVGRLPDLPVVSPSLSTDGRGGYKLTFDDLGGADKVPWRLLAQLPGYATQRSRKYHTKEGPQTIDIEMQHGAAVTGIVQLPDGQPVAGANVFTSTSADAWLIVNGRMPDSPPDGCVCVQTGTDGRFELPLPLESYMVGVVHESGGAEIAAADLAASGKITLQPWAKVEGSVQHMAAGQKPAGLEADKASEENVPDLSLSQDPPSVAITKPSRWNLADIGNTAKDDAPYIDWTCRAELDAAGRFAFDRVLPGRREIMYDDLTCEVVGDEMIPIWRPLAFNAVAGQSAHIEFVRKGRPVGGLVELPRSEKKKKFAFQGFGAMVFQRPIVPIPAKLQNKSATERAEWKKHWLESEAGLAAARAGQNHTFNIAASGCFKADNVAPGVYKLVVDFHESVAGKTDELGERIAWLIREVVVPAAEPKGVASLDLGRYQAEVANLRHGIAAPDFEFQTADGLTHRLAEYRGKTVVLRFTEKWDDGPIWCNGNCDYIEKDSQLKAELTRRFLEPGHGGPVAWINISSDARPRPIVWTPRNPKLEYVQGHLPAGVAAWKAYDFARPCKEVQIAVSGNGTVLTR